MSQLCVKTQNGDIKTCKSNSIGSPLWQLVARCAARDRSPVSPFRIHIFAISAPSARTSSRFALLSTDRTCVFACAPSASRPVRFSAWPRESRVSISNLRASLDAGGFSYPYLASIQANAIRRNVLMSSGEDRCPMGC